jgi:fucose permease
VIHCGYGVGAIFANLLVRPFLINKNSYVNTTVSSQINSTLSKSISVPINADIRLPYLIIGGLFLINAIGHLMFHIRKQNNKQNKAEKRQASHFSRFLI